MMSLGLASIMPGFTINALFALGEEAGLSGIIAFTAIDILLYIYGRKISKERIFSRPLSV